MLVLGYLYLAAAHWQVCDLTQLLLFLWLTGIPFVCISHLKAVIVKIWTVITNPKPNTNLNANSNPNPNPNHSPNPVLTVQILTVQNPDIAGESHCPNSDCSDIIRILSLHTPTTWVHRQ